MGIVNMSNRLHSPTFLFPKNIKPVLVFCILAFGNFVERFLTSDASCVLVSSDFVRRSYTTKKKHLKIKDFVNERL